jgi:site-specific DNA recombinase
MKQVVLYSRVSTIGQVTNGQSLSNQISRLRQYCALKNYTNIIVLTDNGVSAKDTKRPAFQKMLELVKQNKVESIIVYSLSRFSRSVSDCLNTIQMLNKYNVSFHSLSEDINTDSPIGRFFLVILSGLSQMEREQIGERTRSVLQYKKLKGERVGQIEFGKKLNKKNKIINDKTEQNTLAMIKQLRDKKRFTFNHIAERLIELKRKNKSGNIIWNSGMAFTFYNKQIV